MTALRTPFIMLMPSISNQTLRQQIRKQILEIRSQLSEQQQENASQYIIQPALQWIEHYQAEHLAFYLPFNHEISPLALMEKLKNLGKSIYLPVIHPFTRGNLLFFKYDEDTVMQTHRFGMLQPKLDVRKLIPLTELDIIFTPLVACDKNNGRLGYGGGFYDRTLIQAKKAKSVGLAHRCQYVDSLPLEAWDIPLDHIILG